jgi:hypothetical protein
LDAEALKFALERLNEVLPQVPVRIETLAAEEESLRAAVEVFLHDLQTKQVEAVDLLAKLDVGLQDLRRESREGIAVLEGHQDLAVVLQDPAISFEDTLSQAAVEMGEKQLQLASGRVSALGDQREARAGLLEAVFTAASARLSLGGEQIAGAAQAGMVQASEVVTSAETARGALAESVEALGHEIESQRAAGVRDLEELRKDLASLEASFAQRAERVETALRHDLTRLAEDARERTADLRETLEKAAARVTEALHDLDRELEDADQESQGARKDLVPIFEDLEARVDALKQAIESVREAAQVVGIPF